MSNKKQLSYEVAIDRIEKLTGKDLKSIGIKNEIEFVHFMQSTAEYTKDTELLKSVSELNDIITAVISILDNMKNYKKDN